MTEHELKQKLEKIERLFAGATTEGEKNAAQNAREKILKKLEDIIHQDPPVEYKFTFTDRWSRQLFVALARRYGLNPYRYKRQRYTTVMVRVPKSFCDRTLWPEYCELNDVLTDYISNITDKVIRETIHNDNTEAEVRVEQQKLL